MGEEDAVDKWAAWLLHRRDGDDAEQQQKALEHLLPIRQRVLDNARIVPGETVLDVGAGDGLIAFGALDRVGAGGRVVVSDVSDDLLSHARATWREIAEADARMGTTLWGFKGDAGARLLRHAYVLAMANLHVLLAYPWLDPARGRRDPRSRTANTSPMRR